MKKKVRKIQMSRLDATFKDILELYQAIGKIRLSNNRFDIQVNITEYKSLPDVKEVQDE